MVTSGFNPWHLLLQAAGIGALFVLLQKVIGPALRGLWRRSVRDPNGSEMPASFLALLLIALADAKSLAPAQG